MDIKSLPWEHLVVVVLAVLGGLCLKLLNSPPTFRTNLAASEFELVLDREPQALDSDLVKLLSNASILGSKNKVLSSTPAKVAVEKVHPLRFQCALEQAAKLSVVSTEAGGLALSPLEFPSQCKLSAELKPSTKPSERKELPQEGYVRVQFDQGKLKKTKPAALPVWADMEIRGIAAAQLNGGGGGDCGQGMRFAVSGRGNLDSLHYDPAARSLIAAIQFEEPEREEGSCYQPPQDWDGPGFRDFASYVGFIYPFLVGCLLWWRRLRARGA